LGFTITAQFIVLRVFTTLVLGKAAWIFSPKDIVSAARDLGGIPWEKSNPDYHLQILAPPIDVGCFQVSMAWRSPLTEDPAIKWLRSELMSIGDRL
jgi:hypothetical protein